MGLSGTKIPGCHCTASTKCLSGIQALPPDRPPPPRRRAARGESVLTPWWWQLFTPYSRLPTMSYSGLSRSMVYGVGGAVVGRLHAVGAAGTLGVQVLVQRAAGMYIQKLQARGRSPKPACSAAMRHPAGRLPCRRGQGTARRTRGGQPRRTAQGPRPARRGTAVRRIRG